ncbi:hypothetical protein [Bradyrhizobium lablabi]|uniref:hypothetical protein n=1 Tax=Bradyrhizobium lablabi TaxID=722472 RepID=UPI001BADCA51|nr:hypothetical protein [Bradyrhizobium lablabi]MBR0695976.1 hypothetical protein [Bradyrhizobium lablabi]
MGQEANRVSARKAKKGTGHLAGRSRPDGRTIAPAMEVFRDLFPQQTAAELAIRTGADIRHCERCLGGYRDLGSGFQAKLLQSDVGDKILEAIMGEARPAWWIGFKKQLELSKLVKAEAELRKQIETMQRGMAD